MSDTEETIVDSEATQIALESVEEKSAQEPLHDDTPASVDAASSELSRLQTENEALKAEVASLKAQVDDLKVEEAVLREELDEQSQRARAAEALARRVPALEAQIADLQALLELETESRAAAEPKAQSPSAAPSTAVASPSSSSTTAAAASSAEPTVPPPRAAPVEKTEHKGVTPAAAANTPVTASPAETASSHTEAPRKKVTDRWPAAVAASQPAPEPADKPVAAKTKGKLDLSQRWPAASSTTSSTVAKTAPQPREKAAGAVKLDAEAVFKAYSAVRDDSNPISFAAFQHDDTGSRISVVATGSDGLGGLLSHFKPDNRVYGFVRVVTGDALSKRAKFVLLVWAGPELSALKRARHATDKMILKEVVREFAVEMSANSLDDFSEEAIITACRKAGGADYNAQL